MLVVVFVATWIALGLAVAWCTHSKTITGKREDEQ